MFTAVAHKNQVKVETYFDEHFTQNDYYAADELRPAQWIGLGVERLGLNPREKVSREQFKALCGNHHPSTGKKLTLRQKETKERRVMYDFTCSAPKSLSVLALTVGDERLIAAHEEAARVAFGELETFAAARVRKQGRQEDRTTANLVAAAFLHTSSRALDPQLHTHFTVMNCTFDGGENAWKALQAGPMFDAIRYGTEVYRNELAGSVRALGYRTRLARHGFEIEGVSEAVVQRFSKRAKKRDEVVREMEQKLGRKLTNDEVAYAVYNTRPAKIKGLTTAEFQLRQRNQLKGDELAELNQVRASARSELSEVADVDEARALQEAVAHTFERTSVVGQHDLLAAALTLQSGRVDLTKLKQALKESKELIPVPGGWSTKEILETELFLIQMVDAGRDSVVPLSSGHEPAAWLSEDQRRAVLHVLGSAHRITGLRGLAGTGKTTALRELANACASAGIQTLFCAPTAAATDVLRQEGFSAVTLQSLLQRSLPPKSLVVLDEAGAVGIDDMKRLFDLTKDCRVVLSGDTGQHASVPRGDALRILENFSSFEAGQLTRIRRQRRAEYSRVVELAAHKQTAEAFKQLERMGEVKELPVDQLHDAAAKTYLKSVSAGKSALLVAPTWAEIESLTERVRTMLKQKGQVAGPEQSFRVFDSLSWTKAQKRTTGLFQPGLSLHFHRRNGVFRRGETVEVAGIDQKGPGANALRVRRSDGSEAALKLGRDFAASASFDVGEMRELAIAPGDRLLMQANLRGQFVNGEVVQAKEIKGGAIVLADGRVIPKDYRQFTHGYAVTSHAAQGKTVDEVFVVASSRSLAAVNQKQFYVSVSRGRDSVRLFTDDTELLRARVSRSGTRTAAVEALSPALISPSPRLRFCQRLLRWAEQVRNLVRLNGDLNSRTPKQDRLMLQRLSRVESIKNHANHHSRITPG